MSDYRHIAALQQAGQGSSMAIGEFGGAPVAPGGGGVLLATPLYWGCLSLAAWRALWEMWRDPYHWEKTEHGLAQDRPSTVSQASPMRIRRRFYR
jgi:hypothetical protein